MSLCYYLVNTKKKVYYELGKGSWYILNNEKEAFYHPEYLKDLILEEITPNYTEEYPEHIENVVIPFMMEFIQKINENDFFIISDATDDVSCFKQKRYFCVGSRFTSDLTYNGLIRLNSHLLRFKMKEFDYGAELENKY